MTSGYVLLPAAEADLREIVRYTRGQWGDTQAREYLVKLQRGIEGVATGRTRSKAMPELYPGIRMIHCEHHYIFCLPRDDAPTLVVAILHERMDQIARIAIRLK